LSFIFSHIIALSILSVVAGVFISIIVSALAIHYGTQSSVLLWCLGLTFEFMIVVNIAFFFAMVLSSPVTAGMATFGFYILARLMGQLLAIMHKTPIPETFHDHVFNSLSYVVGAISIIIPRLDLLTQTSWLIYGGGTLSDWLFVVLQGAVFLSLVAVAAWIDLRRRQF
jgi:hypothetical protein